VGGLQCGDGYRQELCLPGHHFQATGKSVAPNELPKHVPLAWLSSRGMLACSVEGGAVPFLAMMSMSLHMPQPHPLPLC